MKILWMRIDKKILMYSFGIALILPLYQIYATLTGSFDYKRNIFLDSPYTLWMGITSYQFATMAYFLVLPLLAAMPAAILIRKDINNGFFWQLRIKRSTKEVVLSYTSWSFLLGGLIAAIPLLINFIGYFLVVPNIKPDNLMNINILVINRNTLLVALYYMHPFLHVGLNLFLVFIWGGLFSLFVTASSIFIRNGHFVFTFAFLLQLILLIINAFGMVKNSISPTDFLSETAMGDISGQLTLLLTLFMVTLTIGLVRKGMKRVGDI
ncbi:hypothetical protein [Levilactobacillus brevis]|uniref:hypothetical protein n=1 Tax=Levilactobacillus brevis TaxID=1580 RepID=UPI000A26C17C|nr:hypothetical protein [Levilactobacillus brevis]